MWLCSVCCRLTARRRHVRLWLVGLPHLWRLRDLVICVIRYPWRGCGTLHGLSACVASALPGVPADAHRTTTGSDGGKRKSGGSEACSRTRSKKSRGKVEEVEAVECGRHTRSGSQWLENLSLGAPSCIGLFSTRFMPVGETSNFLFNQSIYTYSPLLSSLPRSPLFLRVPAARIPARPSQCWPFELSPSLSPGRPCAQLPAPLRLGPST